MDSKIPGLEECLAAADETRFFSAKENALAEIPDILNCYFGENGAKKCKAACFADANTYNAAGKKLNHILQAAKITVTKNFIFDDGIHADYYHVETVKTFLKEITEESKNEGDDSVLVPAAVGSGTINDLVKRAADEMALPYLCVPTAASVDGYTAYGAALLHEGFKQTMPCRAPLAVAADIAVLAAAPAYLSSSGYGDLAGKIIAGSDWIISDRIFRLDGKGELAIGTSEIDNTAWAMVQLPLRNNLQTAVNAARGDKDAVKILFEALGITGFSLQFMKDSRAVSGCEHMLSHVWEMENLNVNGIPVTHGHKVTMGTLAGAAFTECLFSEKPPLRRNIPDWTEREAFIRKNFTGMDNILPSVLETAREKFFYNRNKLITLREGILDIWNDLKAAVFEKIPPYAELKKLLYNAGCPVIPQEVNLSKERILQSTIRAQLIRKRFTALDLARELGIFDSVLKKMETGNYFP